jgi:NADH-quinone oxidoreductase subunit J
MTLDLILLSALLLSVIWTVMTVRLVRSVVGLALTSAILAVIMYRLNSPLAAVFELSVCSGLISVIFITTVSFTQRISKERFLIRRRERLLRFLYLPFIIIVVGLLLVRYLKIPQFSLPLSAGVTDARLVLWNMRHLDLLGQVIILIAGVFGVVIFFKEDNK